MCFMGAFSFSTLPLEHPMPTQQLNAEIKRILLNIVVSPERVLSDSTSLHYTVDGNLHYLFRVKLH